MPQILVRDLSPETIERLKARAERHGRSLQGEVKSILETAVRFTPNEARLVSERWHTRLAGRPFTDSAADIRDDRDR